MRIKAIKMLAMGVTSALLVSGCSWFAKEPTRPANPVLMGVSYVGMSVSDLDRATDLYTQSAGLKAVHDDVLDDASALTAISDHKGEIRTRLLRGANAQLRLMQFEAPSQSAVDATALPVNGPGIAHVCFQVDAKTQTYQQFLQLGATHVGHPDMVQLNPKRPVQYAYIRDFDGAAVEIEHVDVAKLELDTPPKHSQRIRQISLATTDMDRIVDFYSVLFEEQNPRRAGRLISISGDKVDRVSGIPGSAIEMAWFQSRNLELEIIEYLSHPPEALATPRPFAALGYNIVVFNVTSLAKIREKLITAGATIVDESSIWDENSMLLARDPDGNLLGFQALGDDSPYSAKQFKDNGI